MPTGVLVIISIALVFLTFEEGIGKCCKTGNEDNIQKSFHIGFLYVLTKFDFAAT